MSLNHIVLMGRLTADPEVKTTTNGLAVTSFTVACDRNVGKDREKQSDFIPCVAWRQTAEFIGKYFSKGSLIAVEGSLQSRNSKSVICATESLVQILSLIILFGIMSAP